MSNFVHLHCHSEFSPDGMGKIEDLVEYVASIGQKALAITDHGTVANLVQHWLSCKKHNIKPIFGCEFYLRYLPDKTNHVTVLAKNKLGLDNLIRLSNTSWDNLNRGRPCITPEMMEEYNDGLIVLTGCPASALFMEDYNFGYTYVETLLKIFGANNVYPELMFTMGNKELYVDRVLSVANDFRLKPVITNDCHFRAKELSDLHPKLTVARKGFDYSSSDLYVKTRDEMKQFAVKYIGEDLPVIEQALDNSVGIANMVENIDLSNEPELPKVSPFDYEQLEKYLLNKHNKVLETVDNKQEYIDRFNKEYKIFRDMNFLDYLYIIYDLSLFCHKEEIYVSLRGSGGGSYLIYLMEIADVDPVKYDLFFERFLNISRSDYPDVDLDIETLRREDVLNYLHEKWGMVGVATYSRYSHKSLMHDIFRVFDIDHESIDGYDDLYKLEALICEYPGIEDNPPYDALVSVYPEIDLFYNTVLGQIRQQGKHAGAVASTNTSIVLPLENGIIALTEGNDKELTKIGVIKLDMLGIRELDRQRAMYNLTGVKPPKNPDDYLIEVFENTFQIGKTISIFQIDASEGIRNLTRDIIPTKYDDLVAAISLYRPGALDAGTAEIYASLKQNGQRLIHPEIDKVLEPTYGVIIYQEQVMSIYALITGEGLEGSDLARRILSPKSAKKLTDPEWIKEKDEIEKHFFKSGKQNGWDEHLLKETWAELLTHTRYSFNRSHAASYAFHALKDAWYLYYYPTEYYTALLQVDVHNKNADAQSILYYAVKDGINVLPPNINVSSNNYVYKDDIIYLPLQAIYRLSDNGVNEILMHRDLLEHKEFRAVNDLDRMDKRKVNKSSLRRLYQIGGCNIDGIQKYLGKYINDIPEVSFIEDLQFDAMQFVIPNQFIIDKIDSAKEKQFSAIGFIKAFKSKKTKNGHPFISYKMHPFGNFWTYATGETIPIGTLVGVKYIVKNNKTFGLAQSVYRIPLTEKEFENDYTKYKEMYRLY